MNATQTLEVPGHQVLQYLGSGARSTIWQVRDCQSGLLCALKRVVKRDNGDVRFLEQAINEYEIGHRLEHPCLRGIYRLRRVKRWLSLHEIHLLMEFCHGQTLQEHRPAEVRDVCRIFMKVAEALAHMNAHGFVHADIKPNNIVVNSGDVKVIDLGQSCRVGTVKKRIQGTPDFIAPEQVRRYPLDARTDVYNFGAALYWTLTGQPIPTVLPNKSKSGQSTLMTDLTITPLEQLNANVPTPLSKLVMDCVELSPDHRPSDMKDVLARLGLIEHQISKAMSESGASS